MKHRHVLGRAGGVVVWIFGILAVACASGCYERVVRAEGLGAQGVAVQKPYRSETALDRAFDGNGSGFGSSSGSTTAPKAPTAPRAPR